MPRGGYRQPGKPAPASGPGKLSRRTDGGSAQKMRVASGGDYGERAEMENIQRSAPMSGTASDAAGASRPQPIDASGLTPLDAESAYPDRDVTYGLKSGPGPDPDEVFGPSGQMDPKTRERLRSYITPLMILASSEGASQETRDYVRRLRVDIG